MIKYKDISLPVSPELPKWPGSQEFMIVKSQDMNHGDAVTNSAITMNLHTGTHVDAPSHFIREGKTIEDISLDVMMGAAVVIRIPDEIRVITADVLSLADIPKGTVRLLLHTANSQLWESNKREFYEDYTALAADGAEWCVAHGIRLIGIDYLSIQRFADGPEVHKILLSAEVVVIEGLNLTGVEAGTFQLYCMPIKLQGLEAAPARVLLACSE